MKGRMPMSMVSEQPAVYRDPKRYWYLLSIFWPLVPVIGIWAALSTGWGILYGTTLILWYGIVTGLDILLGKDEANPPDSAMTGLEADGYYRFLAYLTVPVHYVTLVVCAWAVATVPMAWWEVLLLALSVGVANGLAINTGHEIGHKPASLDRWMAKIVLAVVGYGHFLLEHNRGHHRDVATPEDPASARFGENIYTFAMREIPGGLKRAWNNEVERLRRRGKSVWSLENEVLQPALITAASYGALIAWLGPVIIPFLGLQMAFGWWQLTSANFIEHYGLLRQKGPDGRYERCRPEHSWNANDIFSNLILFHLQRHSDHHANPVRSYQCLRSFESLPTLPAGYPGMFFLSYFPPLWRAVMDKRVITWANGDWSKINLDPAYARRHGLQATPA